MILCPRLYSNIKWKKTVKNVIYTTGILCIMRSKTCKVKSNIQSARKKSKSIENVQYEK